MGNLLRGSIAALAAVYAATCLYVHSNQDRLTFPAPGTYPRTTPQAWGIPFDDLRIPVRGEGRLHAWWIPGSHSDSHALLFFHGNGYVLESGRPPEAMSVHRIGFNALLIDYRGYGSSSPGTPNESRVTEDAEAAMRFLVSDRQIDENRIVIVGRSIGAAIAAKLALAHPRAGGLVLLNPFSSLTDAAHQEWFTRLLPLDLIARHSSFDTVRIMPGIRVPLLIVSGERDELTPLWMQDRLLASARAPKKLYRVPGASHNDIWETGGDQLLAELASFVHGLDGDSR